jgi:hypothetical protein
MGKKRDLTPDSIVYVASWGWRDSDLSGSVVATTELRARTLAEKGIRADARDYADSADGYSSSYNHDYQTALDQIAYYGVHAEKLGTLVKGLEVGWAIQGLNDNGYAFLNVG